MPEKLLLLDFDGTLCLGDAPVLAYAEQVDRMLAEEGLPVLEAGGIRGAVVRGLAQDRLLIPEVRLDEAGHPRGVDSEPVRSSGRKDFGGTGRAHPVSWPLQDGYQLVQLLARQAGLTDEQAGMAFRAARKELLARGLSATDVQAPAGAHELIAAVRERAAVVLATNSPAEAFAPWLEHLGLGDAFDAVINDAAKPFGMPAVLETARQAAGAEAPTEEDILSVGDIWRNDLEHVAARGGTTVLIDRFRTGLGQPDRRVYDFSGAAEAVAQWAGVPVPVNIR